MRRLDAHELLMIGVAGLGVYALYRLATASSASSAPPPGPAPQPLPAPPDDVPILLPQRAGATPVPPAGTLVTLPKDLHPQFWYAGRVELFDTPALTLPPSWLAGALATSGFGGANVRPDAPEAKLLPWKVQIYASPTEARRGGIPTWAVTDAGVGTRWFYGRWTGDVPTTAVPSFVKLMWRAAPPKATIPAPA
jgi:hypothetical protein